jgi:hypothetical protein
VTFIKVLTVYHSWTHSFQHSPLLPPPPIPGIVSTGLIFLFTYMYTYFHHIHPLKSLSLYTLSPIGIYPLDRTHFAFLFSVLVKKKKMTFCLFKIALQGAWLWHFCVYMFYSPNWFISSIFLLSTLSPSYGDFNRFKNSIFILLYIMIFTKVLTIYHS